MWKKRTEEFFKSHRGAVHLHNKNNKCIERPSADLRLADLTVLTATDPDIQPDRCDDEHWTDRAEIHAHKIELRLL